MTSKQQRTKAGLTLLGLAFTYYNNYISSHALLENCADHIYQHKNQYLNVFSRRTVQPLKRLTGDAVRDRRLLVSFLRRVAKLINHGILIKRQSVVINNKPASQYDYCVLRMGRKHKIKV